MNALNIRSAADLRAFAYVLLPVASTLLVTYGILDQAQATMWAGLVTAILGPVLAFVHARSLSTFRSALYAVIGAGQVLLIGYGIATSEQVGIWLPVISTLIGAGAGGVAAANTDTPDAEGY